ncbi:MAG: hypothetical protein ABIA78_04225 [archaeon]
MKLNKRGLSGIVTTLIIIVLVFAAITLFWGALGPVLRGSADEIASGTQCLDIDVRVTSAACTTAPDQCVVTYTRSSGGDDIDGVRVTLSDGSASDAGEKVGNVAPFGTSSTTVATTLIGVATSAKIAAYINDASGNPSYCPESSAYTPTNA